MTMSTSVLKKILKLKHTHIEKYYTETVSVQAYGETCEQTRIMVLAHPFKKKQNLCPICKRHCVCNGYKKKEMSKWRASNLNGIPVYILYRPQRILCPEHGALNEYIPWADGNSRCTEAFNDEEAWLVCRLSKTSICEFEGINWRTVGNCVKASHRRLEPNFDNRLHDNVHRICVDETSYKKGYKYITVVYDMDKNRVIWIKKVMATTYLQNSAINLQPKNEARLKL